LPLYPEGAALHGKRMGIGAFLVIHGAPSHSVALRVESIEPNRLSLLGLNSSLIARTAIYTCSRSAFYFAACCIFSSHCPATILVLF
jgi:hypothetical protein